MYINPKGKGKHNILKKGDRFKNNDGEWATVVEYKRAKDVKVVFDAYEDCIHSFCSNNLRKGVFRNKASFDMVEGSRFLSNSGDWCTVVKYINAHKVEIVFDGYGDKSKVVGSGNLRKGAFKNNWKPSIFGVGYVDEGSDKYPEFVYGIWSNMLARCYDESTQRKQPAYIGCSVAKDWHSYVNFAEWYINQEYYGLGYHLDKDLIFKGNRVYSKDTCTLIPPEINATISTNKASEKGLPVGVNKIDGGYVARLNKGSEGRQYLGYYKTADEAYKVYSKAKERYVKNKALEWANKIEWRAFKALMEWTV